MSESQPLPDRSAVLPRRLAERSGEPTDTRNDLMTKTAEPYQVVWGAVAPVAFRVVGSERFTGSPVVAVGSLPHPAPLTLAARPRRRFGARPPERGAIDIAHRELPPEPPAARQEPHHRAATESHAEPSLASPCTAPPSRAQPCTARPNRGEPRFIHRTATESRPRMICIRSGRPTR